MANYAAGRMMGSFQHQRRCVCTDGRHCKFACGAAGICVDFVRARREHETISHFGALIIYYWVNIIRIAYRLAPGCVFALYFKPRL